MLGLGFGGRLTSRESCDLGQDFIKLTQLFRSGLRRIKDDGPNTPNFAPRCLLSVEPFGANDRPTRLHCRNSASQTLDDVFLNRAPARLDADSSGCDFAFHG